MLGTYSTDMRDTSKDLRTYWIRDGLWYGKARDLGALETACRIPPGILESIPEPDRSLIVDEASADQNFCRELVAISSRPGWQHEVSRSAKRAILNEVDPSQFRNSVGKWGQLRKKLRGLLEEIPREIDRAVAAMPPRERLAVARSVSSGRVPSVSVSGLGELGQWDIISSLVGSVSGAAANIYTAKITTEAQRDIAKLQTTTALQQAQAQMKIQQSQTAQAGMLGPLSSLTSASIGGVPILVVLTVAGVVMYFMFGKKR